MRRAAAGLAAALAVAGCGGGGDEPEGKAASVTQTTKGEVVKGLSGREKFDPEAIYEKLAPGVVTVISILREGVGSARSDAGLDWGFVLDGDGFIATNAHVVTDDGGRRAENVYVDFADGNRVPAKIVGVDLGADVSLLKIDPGDLRASKLVALPLGSTEGLKVGEPVAAIGSPFGERQSLSTGVVSAVDRDIEGLTDFHIGNVIQTDAAINHGNSGGPLLDADGEVIGVNSQIRSTGGGGEGVGFAVPAEAVKRSVADLRAKGSVDYAYLGISSVPLYPQLADRLGLKAPNGALVNEVEDDGPAERAGLRGGRDRITFQGQRGIPVGGDVITGVDGEQGRARAADLTDLIGSHKPGQRVKLEVLRNGKRVTVAVTLGKRPPPRSVSRG